MCKRRMSSIEIHSCFFLSRIPCTMINTTSRSLYRDNIKNLHQIYQFLASNDQTCSLLARFRLWPLVFVPHTGDVGAFLFAHQVFWQDNESLFTSTNINPLESTQPIPLQAYYGKDAFSKQFFTAILQVKPEPTLDDYLALLNDVDEKKMDYIWKCIQVVTRLAFAQNKQSIVRGIDKSIARRRKKTELREFV